MVLRYINKMGFISLLIIGLLCGCNMESDASDDMGNSTNNQYMEENGYMQEIGLSAEEEKILCSIYINEDRIKEGKLYDYQIECLEQIRFAKKYLLQKYPDNSFEIIACSPMNKMDTITEIMFREMNDNEVIYNMQITQDDGEYQAADNYYGCLIREAYDDYFTELLNSNGFAGCITYTKFNHVEGMEIDGKLSVQDILDLDAKLGRDTQIFVEGNLDKALEIEEFVKKCGIYGSYDVYVLKDMHAVAETGKELEEYVSNAGEKIDVIYFNCFE